jgi:hypothetical protein
MIPKILKPISFAGSFAMFVAGSFYADHDVPRACMLLLLAILIHLWGMAI